MKKKRRKSLLLFIPLLAAIYFSPQIIGFIIPVITPWFTSPQSSTESYLQEEGRIDLYFCPAENCEGTLVQFLDSAQQSIHCALYEIDLPSVQQKLLEKQPQLEVQIVTDDDYLDEFNHSFVKPDRSGLMHNKFCIIDGKKVSTGSMNPTENDAHKNNNNLLILESVQLSQNYEAEFQEMWNGTFKKGNSVPNSHLRIGNSTLQNYFCPEDHCAEQVKAELEQARSSIQFMTFSFTHQGIANMLLLQYHNGTLVQGVMDRQQTSVHSVYQQLQYQGIGVLKDGNKYKLHHKVFIIDNKTVITGSFNPTENGDENNDENLLIIKDKDIAARFLEEFKERWEEAEIQS